MEPAEWCVVKPVDNQNYLYRKMATLAGFNGRVIKPNMTESAAKELQDILNHERDFK